MQRFFQALSGGESNLTNEVLPGGIGQGAAEIQQHKARQHVAWVEKHAMEAHFTYEKRVVALKILLSEAYTRDMDYLAAQGAPKEEIEAAVSAWKCIAAQAMRDMRFRDNSPLVLKNFSCMCIFLVGKQCREYGENAADRMARFTRQQAVIRSLQPAASYEYE